jgi:hypothetical protein
MGMVFSIFGFAPQSLRTRFEQKCTNFVFQPTTISMLLVLVNKRWGGGGRGSETERHCTWTLAHEAPLVGRDLVGHTYIVKRLIHCGGPHRCKNKKSCDTALWK